MFISLDILFMVNSNQKKGVKVAANCMLCIYLLLTNADNSACGEEGNLLCLNCK